MAVADEPTLRVVADLADLRVEDASGVGIGRTMGALAETASGLVRYLDIGLEQRSKHVLVPVGHSRFLREERDVPEVRLRAALLEDLERIPAFDAATTDLDDPYERALLHAHGRLFHGERYYAHPAYDHAGLFDSAHPLVPAALGGGGAADADGGAGPGGEPTTHLLPLAELEGWRVARGQADVQGWEVRARGSAVGTVRDLIVEPAEAQVRYLAVALAGGRAVLLPVGFLRLDREAEAVTAPGLEATDLAALPKWNGGPVPRDLEERLREALDDLLVEERRYARPDFASPWAEGAPA
jgi:hypothetical protein